MIVGTIVLEDTTINFRELNGQMELTIGDNYSGIHKTTLVNFEQAGAIIGTSICGTNEAVLTAAAPLVKQVITDDWPKELRCSPV